MHLGMVTDITIAFDDSEASLKIVSPKKILDREDAIMYL